MKHIPTHLLSDRTSIGLQLMRFKKDDLPMDDDKILGAHRDDHYMFFIFKNGTGSLMIDFNDVYLSEGMLYYVLPAQVHNRIRNKEVEGWFLKVDTAWYQLNAEIFLRGDCRFSNPLCSMRFKSASAKTCCNCLTRNAWKMIKVRFTFR